MLPRTERDRMAEPSDIQGSDILLTVFLKHDQSKVLGEFQTALDARDWWERFPPEGVEIVSWTVAMGLGQIVTLRLPPDRLQAVNVELERSAWGVFRTEVFVSYDFMKVRERLARESAVRRAAGGTGRWFVARTGRFGRGAGFERRRRRRSSAPAPQRPVHRTAAVPQGNADRL